MEADIMGDQLKSLFDAISNLGEGKKQADKKQFEVDQVVLKLGVIADEKKSRDQELQVAMAERDRLRVELKDMARIMKRNFEEKEKLFATMKEKIASIEDDLKKATEEAERFQEEYLKSDKLVKGLQNERDKMRQRIQKLKNRRNFNINQKICKQCGKEYLEKENFNWSCRTHRSEFGGEMWWCCGKTTKEAPGCKFSKHFSKEDEDEDVVEGTASDGHEDGQNSIQKNKNTRCFCCKEKGHGAKECPRDPNLKTSLDVVVEERRLAKARDFRKLLSDSLTVTSRLFKGLIKRQAGGGGGVNNPFNKGSLSFDDYSYKYFNEIVLNDKAIKALNEEDIEDSFVTNKKKDSKDPNHQNEDDSILTADHIRDFETTNSEGVGEIGPVGSLGDFLPKEISLKLQKTKQEEEDAAAGIEPGEPPLEKIKIEATPVGSVEVVATPFAHAKTSYFDSAKRRLSNFTEDSLGDDDEEAAAARARALIKPKITYEDIQDMRYLQGLDLFEDISDIKQQVRIQFIADKPTNLIDLREFVRELHYKSMHKNLKTNLSRAQLNKVLSVPKQGSNNDAASDWGGPLNEFTMGDRKSAKGTSTRFVMRADSMLLQSEINGGGSGDTPTQHGLFKTANDLPTINEHKPSTFAPKQQSMNLKMTQKKESKLSDGEEDSQRPLVVPANNLQNGRKSAVVNSTTQSFKQSESFTEMIEDQTKNTKPAQLKKGKALDLPSHIQVPEEKKKGPPPGLSVQTSGAGMIKRQISIGGKKGPNEPPSPKLPPMPSTSAKKLLDEPKTPGDGKKSVKITSLKK